MAGNGMMQQMMEMQTAQFYQQYMQQYMQQYQAMVNAYDDRIGEEDGSGAAASSAGAAAATLGSQSAGGAGAIQMPLLAEEAPRPQTKVGSIAATTDETGVADVDEVGSLAAGAAFKIDKVLEWGPRSKSKEADVARFLEWLNKNFIANPDDHMMLSAIREAYVKDNEEHAVGRGIFSQLLRSTRGIEVVKCHAGGGRMVYGLKPVDVESDSNEETQMLRRNRAYEWPLEKTEAKDECLKHALKETHSYKQTCKKLRHMEAAEASDSGESSSPVTSVRQFVAAQPPKGKRRRLALQSDNFFLSEATINHEVAVSYGIELAAKLGVSEQEAAAHIDVVAGILQQHSEPGKGGMTKETFDSLVASVYNLAARTM